MIATKSAELISRFQPVIIGRPRIDAWLHRNKDLPLRVLFAPAGYGKTDCVIRYLRSLDTIAAFISCDAGTSEKALYAKIADAVGLGIFSGREEFLGQLAELPSCEIAIDALDLASTEALQAFSQLIFAIGENVRFIVGTSSRRAIVASRIFTQGLGVILDQRSLAFAAPETLQLCNEVGAKASAEEIEELLGNAEGWPALIAAIVREAATNDLPLGSTLQTWSIGSAHAFRDLVTEECARREPRIRDIFGRAISGSDVTMDEWRELKRCGMFAIEDGTGYRLIRPVAALFAKNKDQSVARRSAPQHSLTATFFGRFSIAFGGKPVQWKRRRDTEIFAHLLMQPEYSATREQLMARFWSGADKHLAAQSLRTACSNIRKALGDLVGSEKVSNYFVTSSQITIVPHCIVRDIDLFESLANEAADAYSNNNLQEALALFSSSEELYQNEVYAEGMSDIVALAQRLSTRYNDILKRLVELHSLGGQTVEAHYYLNRLQQGISRKKFA
ncbi:MAG: hypothetical protein GIW98_02185 [Candidatus Eremiobacteraeota bacterium]|nr:hypothetical protein [Candidatus Eremiobacteraeota bacterium]